MVNVLFVTSSASLADSNSFKLGKRLIDRIPGAKVVHRDLGRNPPPSIDQAWVETNSISPEKRKPEQIAKMSLSSAYIAELKAADIIVISVTVYNFNLSSSLKAWIDLIVRAGETFQYTPTGAQGLLLNKKVYLVGSSGGTPVGHPMDHYSGYLITILRFIGLNPIFVASITTATGPEATSASLRTAHEAIDRLPI